MTGNVIRKRDDRWALMVDGKGKILADTNTTIEKLVDGNWGITCIVYGDYALVSNYSLIGNIGIVYKFDGKHDIDRPIHIVWMSDSVDVDSGHAIERCINWCRENGGD